jgi:hypothetical protein
MKNEPMRCKSGKIHPIVPYTLCTVRYDAYDDTMTCKERAGSVVNLRTIQTQKLRSPTATTRRVYYQC